ncbi:MAG: class I SAM-dependent methyltransferase [candidate division Zixibacteria bacterium]|nr:class I SAM-dependent methyltransferase [candidate division Zixibacteria bacterium]
MSFIADGGSLFEGFRGVTNSPYSRPQIYDIAFRFRDFSLAVDFLTEASAQAGMKEITSVVELGCGPAQYVREFASRGIKTYGIDLSPEMVSYATDLCTKDNLPCRIIEDDMRSFELPQQVDLAVCMIATIHLLLTNEDIVTHLRCVADNLKPHGLYIIEMTHPRDIFPSEKGVQDKWELEGDGIKVETDWGTDAVMDLITEIKTGTVKYAVTHGLKTERFEFREKWRAIPFGLIRALIELSGRFELAATYGDLDVNKPFDSDKDSWRMMLVLRKIACEPAGSKTSG